MLKGKKAEPIKRPVGRPRRDVDLSAIKGLAEIGCTDDEIEHALHISSSILQKYRATVKEGRAAASTSVRKLQFRSAKDGNVTMQIWLGKQLCGQSDKQQVAGPGGGAIPFTSLTPEENERRIAELLAKGGMQ